MNINSDILEINDFTLTSSREIPGVIESFKKLKKKNILIQIVSFIHNTVLVQSLKNELAKIVPDVKIVADGVPLKA